LSAADDLGEWEDEEAPAGEPAPKLYYPSLEVFVTKYLLDMYRRPVSSTGTTWCPEWWLHSEARVRLEAMWRAWEHLRLDPALGMSTWLHEHADYHMAVLLSSDGPFKGCTEKQHAERPLRPLRSNPPPEGFSELARPHD